jgi:anti-sigma regulatory factor (Ser/Thr protein kinase)
MVARARRFEEIVNSLLDENGALTAGQVADLAGVSRQAAHARLRRLVDRGALIVEGRGRATRYRRAERVERYRWRTESLAEDEVWTEVRRESKVLAGLERPASDTFRYAFTELLNNAIDHSGAPEVEVELREAVHPNRIVLDVIDGGVGIFEKLRLGLDLADRLDALQELSKGKVTTSPERHTGEGIFFTSKAADRFEIESGGLRWIVDNLRGDVAVGAAPHRQGTRVHFELGREPRGKLEDLFAQYTDGFEFTRTRTAVKLFEYGTSFVSRSEAKRLCRELERFREVVLDFSGVESVGQGFVDEVFRVFARAHPEVRLVPINMVVPVEFMVRRGLARR